VKQPTSTTVPIFFNFAGKLLLTALAIFAFLCILVLLMKVHVAFLASQAQLRNNPLYVGNNIHPAASDPTVHPFWPEFPRSSAGNIQSMVINGVQTITEDWKSSASALDILSYYREQMIARGWRDATEETYKLQPESLEAANKEQNELVIKKYRDVMDSNLLLKRGEWSLNITAEPSKKEVGQTTVTILAAATPSIKDLFGGMESALAKKTGQLNQPLDVVQRSGGDRYHTTIATKSETPAQAFQEALVNLGAQGWQPVVFLPRKQAQSGDFAWLVRGKQYAALSVSASPQGNSSSVTLTEVMPAKQ
jgi:hypothetical protein